MTNVHELRIQPRIVVNAETADVHLFQLEWTSTCPEPVPRFEVAPRPTLRGRRDPDVAGPLGRLSRG